MSKKLKHAWEDWNYSPCWVCFDPNAQSINYVETTCILPGDPPFGWIDWSSKQSLLLHKIDQVTAAKNNAKIRDELNIDKIQFILKYS